MFTKIKSKRVQQVCDLSILNKQEICTIFTVLHIFGIYNLISLHFLPPVKLSTSPDRELFLFFF
jgi:hypothetical protein